MYRLITLVLLTALLYRCTEPEAQPDSLTGTWGLAAVYADPGDGSGTYQPVTSERLLVFRPGGSFEANFSFCAATDESTDGDRGTYSLADKVLYPDCETPSRLPFTISGDTLTLTYQCVEGCGERYLRVSDEPVPLD